MNDLETFNSIVKNLRDEGFGLVPKLTTKTTSNPIVMSIIWLCILMSILASVVFSMPIIGVFMFVCLVKVSDMLYLLIRSILTKSMLRKRARHAYLLNKIYKLK